MKFLILSALAIIVIFACNNPNKSTVVANDAEMENTNLGTADVIYKTDSRKSALAWEGAEGLLSIVKTHNGMLSITEGTLQSKNKQLVGGSFIIPLKSLTVLDIPKEKPRNAKLVKHLLSADFFDAVRFTTANFAITDVKPLEKDSTLIIGNLTLKGITKSISFKSKVNVNDSVITASTPKFYINRTDWSISYGTEKSLGDELIKPEIGIQINLVAHKK